MIQSEVSARIHLRKIKEIPGFSRVYFFFECFFFSNVNDDKNFKSNSKNCRKTKFNAHFYLSSERVFLTLIWSWDTGKNMLCSLSHQLQMTLDF